MAQASADTILTGTATVELDLYTDSTYQTKGAYIQIGLNVVPNGNNNGFVVTLSDLMDAQFNSWTAYTLVQQGTQLVPVPVGGTGGSQVINSGSSGWQIPVDTTNQQVVLSFGYQGMWTEGQAFQLWGVIYPTNLATLTFYYKSPSEMYVALQFQTPILTSINNIVPANDPLAKLMYLKANALDFDFLFNQNVNGQCGGSSTGTYPNCTCSQADYYYNVANNDCEQIMPCPTEHCSTCAGNNVPNCTCDSGYTLINGICAPQQNCPSNAAGTYPQCDCGTAATYDQLNNICVPITCPQCAPGSYPNCTPVSNCYTYDATQNTCNPLYTYCPEGASGTYPNCTCPNSGTYNCTNNSCSVTTTCPTGASGTYPNCTCPNGYSYNQSSNTCVQNQQQLSCPSGASGTYPNCTCPNGYSYNQASNACISVGSNTTTTPWYENIWIWIAAGGAGILVLLLILVFRRK
ncbi:MAG: hypothetical protein QXF41_02890 [Candidatus Micrarchaeaceae archaeon]